LFGRIDGKRVCPEALKNLKKTSESSQTFQVIVSIQGRYGKMRPLIIGGVSEMCVGQQLKEFRQSGIEWLVVVMNFTSIMDILCTYFYSLRR